MLIQQYTNIPIASPVFTRECTCGVNQYYEKSFLQNLKNMMFFVKSRQYVKLFHYYCIKPKKEGHLFCALSKYSTVS